MNPERSSVDLAPPAADALTLHSIQIRVLLAIVFLFPIVMCAVVFPTPASDLREHINFGLAYRLDGFAAPPLQTWVAGAVALTGARDSWLYVAVAQVLNFTAIAYLALIAKRFIAADTGVPLVVILCGSAYFSVTAPTTAINADQLQVPLWPAIVFHGLMGLRDDRWRDWLLCGVFVGVAVIAKYSVILLVAALLAAVSLVPAYRRIFLNPKLYAAGLISVPIIALHAVPELSRMHAVDYATTQLRTWLPFSGRLDRVWHFARSYVIYGIPVLIGLGVLWWRGGLSRRPMPWTPAQRLIVMTVAVYVAALVVMILALGLFYETRHTAPFFGLSALAFLTAISIDARGVRLFANGMLALWIAIALGGVVYALVAMHSIMQEPGPTAARTLREAWDRQFRCGPAYIIGNDRSARAIAIYYGRPVLGIAFDGTARSDWFDKDRLARHGAIVATVPSYAALPELAAWFKDRKLETLTLPYRRTPRTASYTYMYYFIAPQECPPA